jgi:uncharacterized protein YukE
VKKQLKADLEALLTTAAGVAGTATELSQARAHVEACQGRGAEFGWYAQRAGIDGDHDQFADAMVKALTDGENTLKAISANLVAAAKDFGLTDAGVADDFHTLPTPHV